MPTDIDDLVEYARFVQSQNPHSLAVFCSSTEQEFIDAVEAALLCAIDALESARKEYANLGELGLSKTIARDLKNACIPATPEEHVNGHVDINITHPRGKPYRYLGECKIWGGVVYHVKGMTQLLDRYFSGRHQRGCCIEFVKSEDTAGKLQTLRFHLDTDLPLGQQGPAISHAVIKGGFITTHRHDSGWMVEVLHFGCNLHQPVPRDGEYRIKSKHLSATMVETNDGFLVRAGSEASTKIARSLSLGWRNIRTQLLETRMLKESGDKLIFAQDTHFSSLSAASSVILGRQSPGPLCWLQRDGRTYKKVQAKKTNS